MSSYHLAPDLIAAYLDALQHYRIRYLLGYTSSIYELAIGALRSKRHDLRMSVVITYAEPVSEYQRSVIAAVFKCEVRETYGMVEAAASASECPAGSLHIWPEVGHVEIIGADGPVPWGTSASLVSTGLLNADMPLIRYRTGDNGALMNEDVFCTCARTLPLLAALEGRVDDVLYTTDGRRIGRVGLGQVLQEQPVIEGQIIQETSNRLRVRVVPAPGFTSEAESIITERLQARMGKVNVILEKVDQVPRGANGKFRAVLNHLSVEERRHLEQAAR
jgi:phenylacetate-CoA ligase